MSCKTESGFWFNFEKKRRWRVQILLRTRKQFPAGSIQTCAHTRWLGKFERFSTELTSWSLVAEKEWTQIGGSTSWKTWPHLKDVLMGCKNAVLHEPMLKNHTINCLTHEENTRQPYNDKWCLFRAPALHLHGTQRLEEETSELLICSSIKWMQ